MNFLEIVTIKPDVETLDVAFCPPKEIVSHWVIVPIHVYEPFLGVGHRYDSSKEM